MASQSPLLTARVLRKTSKLLYSLFHMICAHVSLCSRLEVDQNADLDAFNGVLWTPGGSALLPPQRISTLLKKFLSFVKSIVDLMVTVYAHVGFDAGADPNGANLCALPALRATTIYGQLEAQGQEPRWCVCPVRWATYTIHSPVYGSQSCSQCAALYSTMYVRCFPRRVFVPGAGRQPSAGVSVGHRD